MDNSAIGNMVMCCAGALKLVAEAFPWSPESVFAYTLDNHNSVVGMREEALAAGAAAQAVVPSCDADGKVPAIPGT